MTARKPLATAVAALTGGALLLGGCGSPSATDPGALVGAAAYLSSACPSVGTAPTGAKSITYWSLWTKGEPQAKVLQHAIDCFSTQTGVTVDVQWLGRGLGQQLPAALKTGRLPDLTDADTSNFAPIAAAGALTDLTPVLSMKVGEGDKTVEDVLSKSAWDTPQNKHNGAPYLMPYEVTGEAWWYDKSRLKDLTAPATTADLTALFTASEAAGRTAVAQDNADPYNAYFFTALAEQYLGAGGLVTAANDKSGAAWTANPGILQAATATAAIGKHFVKGWQASKYPQEQNRWADGAADFDYNGSWYPSETRAYLGTEGAGKTVDYGSFQMPTPDGATHHVVVENPIGFAVLAQAKHAQAAEAFVAYVENAGILKGIPAVADNISSRPDLSVPSDLADLQQAMNKPGVEHTVSTDGLSAVGGGSWLTDVFYPLNDSLLAGTVSPQQFVAQLAAKTATFWKSQA